MPGIRPGFVRKEGSALIRDLTVGAPRSVLIKFSLPLLGSVIFQQMYNLADSLIAGRLIGDNALAAIGNAYEVTLVYLAFAFGCNVGCSVVLGQLFGRRNYRDLKSAVSTTYIASGILCLVLMALGFGFTPSLLRLIQTPTDILADSQLYLNIYTGGLLFLFCYNISTGIFSALGDSRTPFVFLVISSLANIVLNLWFVIDFDLGVAGLAWATFLCQGVSSILALLTVLRRLRSLPKTEAPQLFSRPLLRQIVRIAIPSILQQSFVSVGNIFIQSMVNSFGTTVIAAYSAAIKLNNFAVTCMGAIGSAMSNFAAQNIGAQKPVRVQHGVRSGLSISIVLSLSFALLYVLFRKPLIGLFLQDPGSGVLEVGILFLLIVTPFYPIPATKLVFDGILRGGGAMKHFMTGTFADLILRVTLAWLLSAHWGSTGIWLAWPIGWLIGTVLSAFFYRQGVWHRCRL